MLSNEAEELAKTLPSAASRYTVPVWPTVRNSATGSRFSAATVPDASVEMEMLALSRSPRAGSKPFSVKVLFVPVLASATVRMCGVVVISVGAPATA